MRTLILCLLIIPLFQGCTSFSTQSSSVQGVQEERRIALVIGNNDYANNKHAQPQQDHNISSLTFKSNLPSVMKDVDDMSKTLKDLGFEVLVVRNADKRDMKIALKAFKRLLDKASEPSTEDKIKEKEKTVVALFYYSGHGMASDNETYLIPIGMKPIPTDDKGSLDKSLLEQEALRRTDVYNELKITDVKKRDVKKRINFVILDSCRDTGSSNNEDANNISLTPKGPRWTVGESNAIVLKGPKREVKLDASVGANQSLLTKMPDHTFLAYATARDNSSIGTTDERLNSLYTKHLLRFISIPGLPISELFGKVNEAVVEETKQIAEKNPKFKIQEPHFSSNEISSEVNFVFRKEAVNQAPRW